MRATEALESEPIRRYKNSSYKDVSLSVMWAWLPGNTLLPICVITPDFVALCQTIWVYVEVSKIWDAGALPLAMGT